MDKKQTVNLGDALDLHTGEDEEAGTEIIMMWIILKNLKKMFEKYLICT